METGAYRVFSRDRAIFVRAVHALIGRTAGLVEAQRAQDIPWARPQGGSHLVMEVDTVKAVESSMDNIAADLLTTASDQAVAVTFARTGQDIAAKLTTRLRTKWKSS